MTSKTILTTKRIIARYINPAFVRPKSGRIIVTRNCPLRCQMCTFWHESQPDPSFKLIKYWIKELADFGIENIGLGGGEPFIRKDLTEIVKEIKSYGMKCGVTTSGWLADKVSFPPVDHCEISIDGAKAETHDEIRGIEGSWMKAINAIKIAKEHCSAVQLNFVVQAKNYYELVDLCILAKQLDVSVSLIPVSLKLAAQPCVSENLRNIDTNLLRQLLGEALKIGNISNNREFLRIFLSKLDKKGTKQQCMAPFQCILIFTNGDIYPCGNFDKQVGNLSEEKKLEDIYRNYRTLRKVIWSGSYGHCIRCIYPDIVTRRALIPGMRSLARRIFKR